MKNLTEELTTDVCGKMTEQNLGSELSLLNENVKSPTNINSPPKTPSSGAVTPPITRNKVKIESPVHSASPTPKLSASPSSIPGAEVKGKPGTPISSNSKSVTSLSNNITARSDDNKLGGRLTFFKEGKMVLELSHVADTRSWSGWVPVKSKTYWPPSSSTTTTTTIHHPLQHDLHSDHCRKQSLPKSSKVLLSDDDLIFFHKVSPILREIRKKSKVKRNPYRKIKGPTSPSAYLSSNALRSIKTLPERSPTNKKAHLDNKIKNLGERIGFSYESDIGIKALFDKPVCVQELDMNFISPRKRYLKQMGSENSHHRKKIYAGCDNSLSENDNKPSSSVSLSVPHKSAITSQSSVYSIESILGSESINSKKKDSYLRTLLTPEIKPPVPNSNKSSNSDKEINNTVKKERLEMLDRESASGTLKDLKNNISLSEIKHQVDQYDSSKELNRIAQARVASCLGRYIPDPALMMLQSGQVTSTGDMASLLASYSHLSSLSLPKMPFPLLHSSLAAPYVSLINSPLAPQMMRSPNSTARSSPYPIPHSPSPKPYPMTHSPNPNPYPPVTPVPFPSSLTGTSSPRGGGSPWQSIHSPQKAPASPIQSPPPQDAPLNLSKPRSNK